MKRFNIALALILGLIIAAPVATQSQTSWKTYKIMLDPGHGGSDPGASGPQAPHEAALALRCAKELEAQITGSKLGGTVKLTRTDNSTVSLTTRKQMSVSYDPYIFCSIHLNAANKTAHGTETWYYWSTGNSKVLANKVQAQLIQQMGLTNRGVKQNGWTVITGSSSIPAVLTEGLFVDNPSEWGLIKDNSLQGFTNWVNGHLYGFYEHLKNNIGKNVINPMTAETPVVNPTLKVSDSSLYFETTEGKNKSHTFTVTGTNLSGNITVSSNNSAFTVSPTSIGASGGTVTVKFNPSGYAYGEFSGGKITVTNTTNGTTLTKNISLSGKVSPKPLDDLTEIWNFSEQRNTKTKMGYDASKIRNFAYNAGKLYCVYDHSEILVVDAQTGEKLGTLNNGSVVTGGTLTLCDVKVIDGHVIACNLAVAANSEALRLYCWDDDNAEATLLKSITNLRGAVRLGDCMELSGSFAGDMYVTFANDSGSETRIIEFTRADGKTWTGKYYKVTTDGTTQFKTAGTTRAYRRAEGSYVIDGKDSYPTWVTINTSGVGIADISIDTGETWGSSHHETTWGGVRYVGNIVFNGKEYDSNGSMISSKNYKGARVRLGIDTNNDYKRVEQVADYPSDGLGETSQNTNATADCVLNSDGSTYFEVWVLSTTHGMAYFRHGTPPDHGTQPIEPVIPTITSNKKTLSLETVIGESKSANITITGVALTGDITASLSGTDKDLFKINKTSIAKADDGTASGKIKVTYTPTGLGSHKATLSLVSDGATTVKVTLKGTATLPSTFDDNITQLTQGWVASTTASNTTGYSWLETNSSKEFTRDIHVLNGKLYAINARAWGSAPSIQIVDAYTGTQVGTLSLSGVSGGRVSIGGISSIGDKIIVSNSAAPNHSLKVYKWDNDAATPTIWFEDTTHGGVTLGDQINTSGDMADGAVWFSDGKNVFKYTVTNGVVNTTPTVITLSTEAGTTNGSCDVAPLDDGTFWVTGKDILPTHFDASGNKIEALATLLSTSSNAPAKVSALGKTPNSGTAGAVIPFGDRTYIATTTYLNTTTNFAGGAVALMDITDGPSTPRTVGIYPEEGLGTTANDQVQTAVAHELTNNNQTLNLWCQIPYQGAAYYKYEGEKIGTGVEDITAGSDDWKIVINGTSLTTSGGDITSIEVYALTGASVARSNGSSIDLSAIERGIYVVRAVAADGTAKSLKIYNK